MTIGAVAAISVIGLTACGSGSGTGGGDGFKVGIQYDQPGLGLKDGATYTGLDVDMAKYVAKALGHKETDITWVQASSAERETLISSGQVDLVVATYSITDAAKEKVSFAGPYFIAGQDLLVKANDKSITGPATLKGKKLCSVKGSTAAATVQKEQADVQVQEQDTYTKCVEALVGGAVDAVTADNAILAGYASQPAYKGKLKVVGKTFSVEKYGIGLKKGDIATCEKIGAALLEMMASGDWDKAVEVNLGPAGFEVDTSSNPPKPENCS